MLKSLIRILKSTPAGKLLSRSAIYALGDLLTKGARYITLPIFVAVLTVDEIGMLSILQAVSMICWAIATLGLGAAVKRFYHDTDGATHDLLIGRLWTLRLILAAIPISLLALIAWTGGAQFFPAVPITWVLLAILAAYLRAGTDVLESWYIIREEPIKFRTFTFIRFLTTTLLVLGLVVIAKWGVFGVVLGETIGFGIWCAISGYLAWRPHRKRESNEFQRTSLGPIFRYSLPIIPHAVFLWSLVTIDRIILQQYVDREVIGIYEIAYLYGSLLIIVAAAINVAWLPDFFRTAAQDDGPQKYGKTSDLYFGCVLACGAMLSILAAELIGLLTSFRAIYSSAIDVSRIVLLGTMLQALFIALSQPLFFTGRTGLLACVSGFGLTLNVIANVLMVPKLGITGAAWATVIAYGGMSIVMWVIVNVNYRIPWNYLGLIGCGSLFAVICILAPLGSEIGWTNLLWRLVAVAIVCSAIFAWFRFSRKIGSRPVFSVAAELQKESA